LADASQTLLEVANHLSRRHPEFQTQLAEIFNTGIGAWAARDYSVPCPKFVKDAVLKRQNLVDSTWVETGTYHGETTLLLSQIAKKVFTIEPEVTLYETAKRRFAENPKVTVINDISENAIPLLLPVINGNVCFWLDGHYSGGVTFAGPNDTPLVEELREIQRHLHRFSSTMIAIDDIRFCGKSHMYGEYPSLDYLVDWARANKLEWHIEYDIFIARSG